MSLLRKVFFKLQAFSGIGSYYWLKFRGLNSSSFINLKTTFFSWPHKVRIGQNTIVEHNVYFKHDGPYSGGISIDIGKDCFIGNNVEFNIKEFISVGDSTLIGSGCKFIDHDHGLKLGILTKNQPCPTAPIHVDENVWIGANVVILKGVHIGKNSVIGAGAVVNKPVPPNEIWGGVPARKIRNRD